MAIKIKSIRQIPVYIVFTDQDPFGTFRRIGLAEWECLVVDKWEPEIRLRDELEELFFRRMNGN